MIEHVFVQVKGVFSDCWRMRIVTFFSKFNDPRIARALSIVFSVALIIAIAAQLQSQGAVGVSVLSSTTPAFWFAFLASYLVVPFADWIIFRRLWNMPVAGMAPLIRKSILNALLISYAGEAYFFNWARQRAKHASSAFGAVKDVAILSALVGNGATLVLILIAWPLLDGGLAGIGRGTLLISVSALTLISSVTVMLGRKVFHLEAADLIFVTAIHFARTVLSIGLLALMWHLALPTVALHWWVLLSTGRMVVSRLPLLPNKDAAFAAGAAMLFQQNLEIAGLMTLTALLILAAHLVFGVGLVAGDIARCLKRWQTRAL